MNAFFERIEANARDAEQRPVTIVAFGDSVTQGVTEHRCLEGSRVYHRLLQERLEAFFPTATFQTINAGVAGNSAMQGLERLERDVLGHAPDLVLIAFGLNDALEGPPGLAAFGAALRAMVRRIRTETGAAVACLTPPLMARRRSPRIHPDHEAFAGRIIHAQTSGALAACAGEIRRVATETGALLADVHAQWERLNRQGLDTDIWLANGLNHPDARGHRLAAELLFARLLALAP